MKVQIKFKLSFYNVIEKNSIRRKIMKIGISAESTIDLPKNILEENDIHTIPFQVILGDQEYKDGDITSKEIFESVKINKVLPKTSAINESDYAEYFKTLLNDYDAIVHISLSSKISSAFSNAEKAANNLKNVYVIDSKSLSTGIALLALYAVKDARNGLTAQEVYRHTLKQVKNVQASFIIDKLDYLHKGGRCSALSLLGANLLKIHPQILLEDGTLKVHKKYRGKLEKVVADYCEDVIKEFDNPNLDVAFITYTTATPEMINIAKNALKNRGFEKIYETTAGATISSHCGEQTLGILYLNN